MILAGRMAKTGLFDQSLTLMDASIEEAKTLPPSEQETMLKNLASWKRGIASLKDNKG